MPSDESMTDAERILKDRERATVEALKRIKESTIPPALDGTIGRLTHIDAYQQQQIALRGQRALEFQMRCIQNALQRVKEGTYGACVECGLAIPAARLEATPEAPFCAPCQERREQEGRD